MRVTEAFIAGRRAARRPLARRHALPDFLIVGAQKAGTTSLYSYLCAAGDVRPAVRKEVHYFDHHHDRGEAWYRSNFPVGGPARPWRTGEASPYYLLHPHAPVRAAALIPSARLVVLLRNPVERAHSHFNHSRTLGMEPLADFASALAAEPERTDDAWARLLETGGREPAVERWSYLRRGLYAAQVHRWLAHFPASALLLLTAEELFTDPVTVLARTRAHLGLPPAAPPAALRPQNARAYEPLPDALRRRLADALAADAAEVETLLGRPTGWTL